MRRFFLFLCGVALLGAAPIRAQSLLPSQFGKWSKGGCVDKPATTFLAAEAKQNANVSCEYSSQSEDSSGNQTISVWAGRFYDPTSAYEVFTASLRPGMMPTNVGHVAAFNKDGVLVLVGNIVLRSTANISKEDLGALVRAVEPHSDQRPLPPVRTYLPAQARLVGSERYALGPVALKSALAEAGLPEMPDLVKAIGFSKEAADAEAMLARYASPGKGNGVLLLLDYPTPNVAEQHIHHLAEVLPASARLSEPNILRKGSLLSIALTASSPEYAASLRQAADYATEVTWNEPHQTMTDPPWATILGKIIIFTMLFMVVAVVLGVAFGGVRVLTKVFFPGKVFDRPEQLDVLQLGVSGSKRINSKDFY